jgi:tRNA dimethylallyltransferase
MQAKPKVIAVVGPTASGKTSLSIALAKEFSGEVISADSRQVYRGLDLGTGKVTTEEMGDVPHHLLDVADPMSVYTGSDFKRDADSALTNIIQRQKLPIVAGGTFFYLDLLRDKFQAAPVPPDDEFRLSISDLSNATLHEKLYEIDPIRAGNIDPHNRRRLVRALEIARTLGKVPEPIEVESPYEWLLIGIDLPQEQLHHNIHLRLLERMADGMLDEAKQLHTDGMTYERMDTLGLEYRYLARHLQGVIDKDTMLAELETKIRQFAKRQLTWLKRDKSIEWFAPKDRKPIFERVHNFLHT